ncbi:Colistin resistance protein EmrA [Sporomusa carbonis]|uniref:HlyD family secretion protein n=1 Tax=Sporomusa carbonis TaxID=3076075 RepID=UPI003A745AF6
MQEKVDTKANGKPKKLIIGLLIAFLSAGAVGGGWWWYENTRYVSTDDARVGGTIVSVSPKIAGRITELLVKEGDRVKAGQIVAKIDPRDILAQKAQAEAALAAAKAHYEELTAGSRPQEIEQARSQAQQARANLDNAQKNYERVQKLYQEGAVSASQLDNADTAYQVAREALSAAMEKANLVEAGSREESIRAAAAQVKQAEAALEAANVMLDNTTVVSPVDGTVAVKSANAGEVVSAGQSIVTIADLNDVWVSARVEETKIGKIKVGQEVEYTVDGYGDHKFTGTVYEIGSATNSVFALIPTENSSGNFTKVTQRIPIKITVPQDSGFVFRPGMSVYIKIHVG